MLELLILLSSDISPYRDTFDMIHRYTWSLYRPISSERSIILSGTRVCFVQDDGKKDCRRRELYRLHMARESKGGKISQTT